MTPHKISAIHQWPPLLRLQFLLMLTDRALAMLCAAEKIRDAATTQVTQLASVASMCADFVGANVGINPWAAQRQGEAGSFTIISRDTSAQNKYTELFLHAGVRDIILREMDNEIQGLPRFV